MVHVQKLEGHRLDLALYKVRFRNRPGIKFISSQRPMFHIRMRRTIDGMEFKRIIFRVPTMSII